MSTAVEDKLSLRSGAKGKITLHLRGEPMGVWMLPDMNRALPGIGDTLEWKERNYTIVGRHWKSPSVIVLSVTPLLTPLP